MGKFLHNFICRKGPITLLEKQVKSIGKMWIHVGTCGTAALHLLRLAGIQSVGHGMQGVMHDMTTELAMVRRRLPQNVT